MTDSLKFGPEWLRNMSADVTTSVATTTLNNSSGMRYPLAEFRYGREEMLSLFDKNNVRVPDILPNFKKLFIDKVQCPLALTPSTEDDMRLWTRPVGITSGGGGSGTSGGGGISTRGSSRGGSVDRGRGRGRGTFHPSITHQRSTSLFDDDSRGAGTVRSSERVWPERNGGGTPINNNALVNEIVDWSSSSSGGGGGGGIGNSSISSPRKEFSSHNRLTNDNWRRTRLEEDMITSDGWRSASSASLTRQTSEKWGRSTSWRDEESSQSFDKSSQGDKPKDYADDLNDDLPEWATEDPHEGGGSFDSSGAFHGSDEELQIQHHIQKMYRDEHHHRDHHHMDKENCGDDHNMDLGDKSNNGGMDPISNKPDDIIPPAVEPSSDESNLLNQSTNNVDRMQKVADDMVEKLIMDDESNSSMSSRHVMQVVEDGLKKIIMTDDLNHGMPGMNEVKSAMQQNREAMRRGPDPSKLLKPDENVIVPPQMSQMPSIIPPPHISQPVAVIGSDLWFYHDPQGNIQGPFTATEMAEWYRAGYFDENLYLRRQCDARFSSLGELVEMCNGAIPFLASHLLPPVGFPIIHPKVDPLPPQQQQQQPEQSHSRHSPGIATPTKLPGNMMDINYLLQKQQYIMRHQQHAANHLVQKLNMEPWNLLPPDQRNKMLEQIAVSQISQTPYHPDSLMQQHQQQRQKQPPQNMPPQLKSSSGGLGKPQHFVQFDHTAAVPNDSIHQYIMSQPQLLQRSGSGSAQPQNDMLVENDPINNLIMQLSIQKNGSDGVSNSLPPPSNQGDDRTQSPWLDSSAGRLNPMIGGKMNMLQIQQSQNQKSQIIGNMLINNMDLESQNMHQGPPQSNHSHDLQHSSWNNNGSVVATAASSVPNKNTSIWDRLPDGSGNSMLHHQTATKSMQQQHIEISNSMSGGITEGQQNVFAAATNNNSIKNPEPESYHHHHHHQTHQSNMSSIVDNQNISAGSHEIEEVNCEHGKLEFSKFGSNKKEEKTKKSLDSITPSKKDFKKSASNDDFIVEKGKKSKKDKSATNNQPATNSDDILLNSGGTTTTTTINNKSSNAKKVTNEKISATGFNANKTNNSNDRASQNNSNSITKSVAPWSFAATPAATSQSPSLAEIQKSEMERRAEQYRYEQILREQQQQTMMGLAKANTNATFMWSGRNVLPKNIKSLAEIQAEEHAKQQEQYNNNNSGVQSTASSVSNSGGSGGNSNPLNYSRSNTSLNLNSSKLNKNDESGKVTFSALLNNNNWSATPNSGTSRNNSAANNNNTTATNTNNLSVLGKFLLNYSSPQGIWEEQTTKKSKQNMSNSTTNSLLQSHQNMSQTPLNQQSQQSKMMLQKSQTVANMPQTTTKLLQNNNSHNLIGGDGLCGVSLNNNNNNKNSYGNGHPINQGGHKSSMDNDIASKTMLSSNQSKKDNNKKELQGLGGCGGGGGGNSNEFINWCIKTLSNLTNTVDVPTFATFLQDIESPYEVKDYIKGYLGESREYCEFAKQFLERRSKYKNQQRAQNAHIDDMCQPAPAINPGTNDFQEIKGKGKKIKKNKMTKLDSRILGFSVTAAQDRINVGDRDYGDAS